MKKNEYKIVEDYMLEQMKDSAHDKHHVYRVLNFALDIAYHEVATNDIALDILVAACLLHDIGREKQFANPGSCHAQIGGEMAYEFLSSIEFIKWSKQKALHVKECISTHRYRRDNKPQSIEAKILFDADKLDASGALGIARTLMYEGEVKEPLYRLDENGKVITGDGGADISTFFQEYNYKLKHIYDSFYTERAKELAVERKKTAEDFYNRLYNEITMNYENGLRKYQTYLESV